MPENPYQPPQEEGAKESRWQSKSWQLVAFGMFIAFVMVALCVGLVALIGPYLPD